MPLKRTDSASSTWLLPHRSDDDPDALDDQRRIRHLSAVLVHNLSLDPRRDQLAAALFSHTLVPSSLDLVPTSAPSSRSLDPAAQQGRRGSSVDDSVDSAVRGPGRRRAESAASWNDGLGADSSRDGERRLPARVRPRRSSSAGTLLAQPSSRIDEEEPASPNPADDAGPSSASIAPSTSLRTRSASRASIASAGSSSTIRQAPRIPPPAPQQQRAERPPPPSAAQFAQREKQRRDEALRRRLVDSFVSLELVPDESGEQSQAQARVDPLEAALAGRRRSGSVASAHMQRSGSAGSAQGTSSGGPSSWVSSSYALSSPRKAMRRRMTASSLLSTSASFPTLASTSATAPPRPAPFFVSHPSLASTRASFPVDPSSFLLPLDDADLGPPATAAAAPALPDDPTTSTWSGLREGRLRAKVFARPSDALRPSRGPGARTRSGSRTGKEKEREEDEDEWRLVAEWEVELDGLTSLGRDPTLFPSLPPNTLIFALSPSAPSFCPSASSSTSTDTEYFTAPLPLLRRAARPRRRSTAGARATRSLSEDEASCSSCSASDGEDDPGNLSDPGVGAGDGALSRARTRPRSGTLRAAGLGRLPARSRARSDPQAQAARRDEAHLRRVALVERSRRETRMVRCAEWGETRRVWEGEREAEELWGELREVSGRVARVLGEDGEGGWAKRERERAEMQDRVDDLEAVKEAEQQELEEDLAALEARRAALRARRARLERARALAQANQEQVGVQRAALDEQDRSLADLGSTSRTRRTQLITLLSHIFPIEPVSPSPSSKTSLPPLLFSIVGLALPNSSYPPSYTDDTLSSALGYAAHVTHLVAAYLGVPLCYPLRCRASRSVVVDEISMMKGPRAFPLYGRGVDRYRFDYGVFLLNKNIEQLMYSQGLTVLDLRNTLPNLKTLILSLSYDPSHADYLSATLLPSTIFSDAASPAAADVDSSNDAGYVVDDGASRADEQGEPSSMTNGRSRSSSLASTIRPSRAKSASSASRTSSRSSSRRSSRTRGGDGEGDGPGGRAASPASLAQDGGSAAPRAPAPNDASRDRRSRSSNGHANGAAPSSRAPAAAARAEKRAVPVPAPGPVSVGSSAPSPGLKVRVVKPAGGAPAGDGGGRAAGGGGGGYGARIRDGLWSAVAGNVAAAGGGSGGRGGAGDGR
ncbi:hypothetical protein JCM3775_003827 [Rhodotorula graminis]